MNARNLIVQIAVCLASCTHHTEVSSPASAPAVNVTLTHISYGNISNDITLSASTAYLNKSVVTAPIADYIVKVYVQVGDKVKAGQPLCELESKEQHTLASANVPSVIIRAGQEGVLLNVSQQAGDYVQEGTPLCTLGVESSFVFLLNVPYEASECVMKGKTLHAGTSGQRPPDGYHRQSAGLDECRFANPTRYGVCRCAVSARRNECKGCDTYRRAWAENDIAQKGCAEQRRIYLLLGYETCR